MTEDGGSGRGKGRRALGRGLDALLPSTVHASLREVDVDRIEANPRQPRQRFTHEALDELATSIREHGVVQPLVVSAVGDDRYRLIVGERRWRAARLAGLERVPVVVKDASDRQTLEIALVENVQRADLNPLEEAEAYNRLIDEFGLTQKDVAGQVGKSRSAIANTLRLLALPEAVKEAVVDGDITEGHARALLPLPTEEAQIRLLKAVERQGLTVRQTEDLVRRALEPPAPAAAATPSADVQALEDDLRRALGTKVSLRHGAKGGRIVIEYFSDEEFQTLYDRLTAGN